jgi:Spy/CpxP family protein refolding chaperone
VHRLVIHRTATQLSADLTAAWSIRIISGMARSVQVVVSDDLDGSDGAEGVGFGFDGVSYEIDLTEKNRAKLEKDFAPYVQAARRISRSRRPSSSRQTGPQVDRAQIRAWAKENGLNVSERGRISAEVIQQYEAAH